MSGFQLYCASVAEELKETILAFHEAEANQFIEEICGSKRIFICGQGRCLLMLRAFAMRLMHLGFTTYVVWDTTTPAIGREDLLVIGSAAGRTRTVEHVAERAKAAGARLGFITMAPDSPIGQYADFFMMIKGRTSDCGGLGTSVQPGGGRFEQGMLMYCDVIIARLGEAMGFDKASPYALHTNLE